MLILAVNKLLSIFTGLSVSCLPTVAYHSRLPLQDLIFLVASEDSVLIQVGYASHSLTEVVAFGRRLEIGGASSPHLVDVVLEFVRLVLLILSGLRQRLLMSSFPVTSETQRLLVLDQARHGKEVSFTSGVEAIALELALLQDFDVLDKLDVLVFQFCNCTLLSFDWWLHFQIF